MPKGFQGFQKGHPTFVSKETYKKISEKIKGEKHYLFGKHLSEETKKKLNEARKGQKHSEETKRKISEFSKKMWEKNPNLAEEQRKRMIGEKNPFYRKYHTEQSRKRMSNSHIGLQIREKNGNWKGDSVGYFGLHLWIRRKLGKPTKCEHCGKDNLSGKKIHWANISGKYKREISDWIRLCAKCHKEFHKQLKEFLI